MFFIGGMKEVEKQNGVPNNRLEGDSNTKFSSIKQLQNEGWENIPPYRQLKVLLVEDDDSTRHVVAALLRNCGYQVMSVSNGLQAWALLDDGNREFDLVLTDVVMPGLSGIALLSRIMHHEKTKKIPVIMMSSHDSTQVVFKCLSKGAADFLVKPVRKNELKNLWQHSWRRCQSSSGSESETGRVHRCRGSSEEMSSQSDSDDVRVSDGSDNGSGTQSSYTKRGTEIESPRKARQQAYVRRGRRKDSDTVEDLESHQKQAGGEEEAVEGGQSDAQAADLIANIANEQAVQRVRNNEQPEVESEMGGSNSPEPGKDGNSSDPTSTSKLELSLRSSSAQQPDHSEPNVLRQSGVSAFSRYNTLKQQDHQQQRQQQQETQVQQQTTDNKEEPGKDTCFLKPPDQIMGFTHPVQYAALVSYDQNLQPGAAAYYYAQPALPPWQHAFSPQNHHHHHHEHAQAELMEQQQRSFQAFTNILAHHHHYHIEHHHHENRVQNTGGSSRDVSPAGMEASPCCGSTNVTTNQLTNNGFSGSSHGNNGFSGSSHGNNGFSGSSHGNNGFSGSSHGNNGFSGNSHGNNGFSGSSHGNNGSISGSNNGSNGFTNNHSSNNLTLHGTNGESGSGNHMSSSTGILTSTLTMQVSGSPTAAGGPEQNRVRREAALNKFRQKRKERCFEKKVRYQSRKRLAEQRPRVRGQFVSQAVYDSSMNNLTDT